MSEGIDRLRLKIRIPQGGRWLLGLSGGADSVAMLTALLPEIREGLIKAEAVHVNHGLRGTESDEDEAFCRELCDREGIPLHIRRVDLGGRSDEAAARKARYDVFRELYSAGGFDGLALAHHADDQAETFLMRLLRGAGPEGLECMKEEEDVGGMHILRPLLNLRREEIREALRADGILWREDSSNLDSGYLRNRIRLELMPALEQISGNAAEKIHRAARLIGSDNEALNAQAAGLLERAARGRVMKAAELAEAPYAVRSRALRMWWQAQGPERKEHALSAAQTEALDGLLFKEKGKINLPGETHAVRDGRFLILTGEEFPAPAPVQVTAPETVFGAFRMTESASEGVPGDGKRVQEVPAGFVRGCVIRTRRPGDRIRPFGSSGSRKLQDYLTDRKIAEPFRDRIPLLCRGDEVLLAGGVGAGAVPAWDGTQENVRLTWHGDMPWTD